MSDTARFTLPLIEAAQAQKHVTHNEALVTLDALAHLHLLDRDLAAPPGSPADGDTYLVAAGATGAWAGHDGEIAWALDGGWRFQAPVEGMLAHVADEDILIVYSAAAWSEVSGAADISTVPALGIGTAADETETDTSNRLIVRGSRALFDAAPDSETPGTGDFKVQVSKEAAGNFASFFFANNYDGRAELGLLADDDFAVKVSPDGAAWAEALRLDKDTAGITLPSALLLTGAISPAEITADQDDYAPSGFAAARIASLTSDDAYAITGLAGGADGREVILRNANAADILTLKEEDANSAAASRFALGADFLLRAGQSVTLRYDGAAGRWRMIAHSRPPFTGFRAWLSSNQSMPDSSFTTIVFDTESVDAGGYYDNGTGAFTPPAGQYAFVAAVRGWFGNAGTKFSASIAKNGSLIATGQVFTAVASDQLTSVILATAEANGDDAFTVQCWHNDGTTRNAASNENWTFFHAWRIG